MPPFRSVKLRQKKAQCPACGDNRGIIEETDYVAFCGGEQPDWESRGLLTGQVGDRMTPSASVIITPFQILTYVLGGAGKFVPGSMVNHRRQIKSRV